ncbi:MAG: hypothetical protein K2H76_04535 [Muribaculaceae bacterium]|nr:hypothetical protein [Muribaculaceae bacterium]
METEKINSLIAPPQTSRKAQAVENAEPIMTLPPSNVTGNIDAPNGELWYYTGEFEYLEIPPHDNVVFTDRILQEYTFTIYDSQMRVLGVIKDKVHYQENETRVPQCDLTPVATRNFFNTDDTVEIMVALAVNTTYYVNNYRTLVYALGGEKDEDGFDKPIDVLDDFVGDVIEGPSTDGSDNFYLTFMSDIIEEVPDDCGFWDYLLAQKAGIIVYGKAIDDKGPRKIFETVVPLIQLPGDQENVPVLMSMLNGDEVVFCISQYKEPFYNRYDDPMNDDMTMREGNSLVINLYKATEESLDLFSTTEIPMELDPMKDAQGNPTCLFSYYSVGSLGHRADVLFNAPGTEPGKPDFIITRGNYQVSTDGITNSYFTYKNDGSLKNTLFLYADGTRAMGDIPGFEPQQMFVSKDQFGYLYDFVDLYSAKTSAKIDANYYYDDDSDPELLTANVDRTPAGDSYQYVFELRYPLVDDNENDILRFMYIDREGKYDHTEFVNMGQGVAYAQSYVSTEALAPHAYSTSDTPAFMMLFKRGVEGSEVKIEELMVAEAFSAENPEGKTLLQVGPDKMGVLASIVPEFAHGDQPGRLFVYYYDDDTSKYALDIYHLPINEPYSGINVAEEAPQFSIRGSSIVAQGEIRVFTIDGKLVASGLNSVEFASLDPGIYVINVAGKSYKVSK